MNNQPLVSIIVPNYNGAKYLKECIDSVLRQTYNNWELIICDDKSNDNSLEVISGYADKRILPSIVLKNNKGAAIARNTAIEKASGRYIAFLDNDDYWSPDKLEGQIQFMATNEYTFTYTNYIQFTPQKRKSIRCKSTVSKADLLKNNYILTSTVIYDTLKLGKIYMANIRKRQDWSLFINIVEQSGCAYNFPYETAFYRKHDDSISANKIDLIKYNFNFYNQVLGYNKLVSVLLMIRFLFYYFVKKIKEKLF